MIQKGERALAQQGVLRKLGELLAPHGFASKASGQSFYRRFAAGVWSFHVAFIPHPADFDMTADVAVRINAIEDLVNQYDTKLRKSEKRSSVTLGGELGNISGGCPARWTVDSFNDIPPVCSLVVQGLETIGLPFLQANSDVTAVHRLLSTPGSKATLLDPFLGTRSMRTLAAASIVNESGLSALAKRLEEKLIENDDLYLEDFRALCRGVLARQIPAQSI